MYSGQDTKLNATYKLVSLMRRKSLFHSQKSKLIQTSLRHCLTNDDVRLVSAWINRYGFTG